MATAIEGGFLFEGIMPDEDLRAEARRVFDEIAGLAPYGANFDARITRQEQGNYVVDLSVSSSEGRFKAVVQGDEWQAALTLLEHTMQGKFECWRQNRFRRPSSGWVPRKIAA